MTRSRITSQLGAFVVCGGLVAALTSGCKQPLLCPALDNCGGAMPVGDWVLDPNHPSCSEELYTPPPDPRLIQADVPAARTPAPEPALFDWCQLLVTGHDEIVTRAPPFLFVESPPVGRATLRYDGTGRFALSTTRTGTFSIDYPSFCVRAFGAKDLPGANVCQQLEGGLRMKLGTRYRNITCSLNRDDDPGQAGCFCDFDLVDVQESKGAFFPASKTTLRHLPGNNFPETVSYCSQGDRLQLTGVNGEFLFDRLGLRTLDLVRLDTANVVNCTDGVQGTAEDGIDCGPVCEVMCSAVNCNDKLHGPGEDGIDCGRRCPAMLTCPPPPATP